MPSSHIEEFVTVRDAISDLSYLESGEGTNHSEYIYPSQSNYQKKLRRNNKILYNHIASNHSELALKIVFNTS